MTITHEDIYNRFLIEYDKANITSSYSSLTKYEAVALLNKAYVALISLKLTGNNPRRAAFEADVKSIEDLQPLITTVGPCTVTTPDPTNGLCAENEYTIDYPVGMMYYLQSFLKGSDNKVHNTTLISHQSAQEFKKTAINTPWIEQPVVYMENNKIHALLDDSVNTDGLTAYVTYIKTPLWFEVEIDENYEEEEDLDIPFPALQNAFIVAEEERVAAESAREEAEAQRVTSEQTRINQEATRQTNEQNRNTAEQSRVSAEQSRDTAEQSRSSAETTRESQETTRQTQESNRTTAEGQRASAESSRSTAETERNSAELSRVTAESNRVTAESNRVSAETGRVNAELARVDAESARVTAENQRVANETQRLLAVTVAQQDITNAQQNITTLQQNVTTLLLTLETMPVNYISVDSLNSLVGCLESALDIKINKTWNQGLNRYVFTFEQNELQ